MLHLSTWEEMEGDVVLQLGKQVVKQGDQIRTETELRDRLIDLVSVGNPRHKPEALFRQFMMRISLPRLAHFFDLVLPQLMPVQAAWADEGQTLWSGHHIRFLHTVEHACKTPRVKISYFSPPMITSIMSGFSGKGIPFSSSLIPKWWKFRDQASHVTHQQHLQMGLRKGMAILVY